MLKYLEPSWQQLHPKWQEFFNGSCINQLIAIDEKLTEISHKEIIFPPRESIFRALYPLTPDKTKIVILGQDPYHGENQSMGLAFAVNPGVKHPPSLKNIFKELALEYNPLLTKFESSLLQSWANQGVLLLNASLTVIKDKANSLAYIGWHKITDLIIQHISDQSPHCVFMLWGNYAREKKGLIDQSRHLILEAVHPSPLSANRGFFGCNHFKLANQYLDNKHIEPINWLA